MSEPVKNAHTPGPWFSSIGIGATGSVKVLTAHNGEIAGMVAGYKVKLRIPDAHLIAAAPEMLEALKSVEHFFRMIQDEQYRRTVLHQTLESASKNWELPSEVPPLDMAPIHAAIAKAEGR